MLPVYLIQDRGTAITRIPTLGHHKLDLVALYQAVIERGGVETVRQFTIGPRSLLEPTIPACFLLLFKVVNCVCSARIGVTWLQNHQPIGDFEQGVAISRTIATLASNLHRLWVSTSTPLSHLLVCIRTVLFSSVG